MAPALLNYANIIIQKLQPEFTANRLRFEMACSTYLAGEVNKQVRQAMMLACELLNKSFEYDEAERILTKLGY